MPVLQAACLKTKGPRVPRDSVSARRRYRVKSFATDAQAFSQEMDDILSQADQDAASVQEMEQLLGAMPELSGMHGISDEVGRPLVQTPDELEPIIGAGVPELV